MSGKGKDVGAPPPIDFNLAMGNRYNNTPQSTTASTTRPGMTRRSFYLPVDVVEQFVEAADQIHHATRGKVSKGEAQAALLRRGIEQIDVVLDELNSK